MLVTSVHCLGLIVLVETHLSPKAIHNSLWYVITVPLPLAANDNLIWIFHWLLAGIHIHPWACHFHVHPASWQECPGEVCQRHRSIHSRRSHLSIHIWQREQGVHCFRNGWTALGCLCSGWSHYNRLVPLILCVGLSSDQSLNAIFLSIVL